MAENIKIMEKIEDFNERRALVKNSLKALEQKKHDMKPEKYKKHQEKLEKKLEKIREKIKKLEEEIHH